MSKFSSEEDERLIDLVREHPALYQVKSRSYKDNTVKNNIWKRIGEELGKKSEDCKGRWKSIRDYYQRKRKDYLKGTGTGSAKDDYEDIFLKKFQHLRFLDGSAIVERKTICNTQIDHNDENSQQETPPSEQETQEREQETEIDNNAIGEIERQTEDIDGLQSNEIAVLVTTNKRKMPNNNNEQPQSDISSKRKKHLVSKKKNYSVIDEIKKGRAERTTIPQKLINSSEPSTSEQESRDPATYMFFKSIAATVSSFSPVNKAKIKAEIMNTVSQYEIQHATQQSNVYSGPVHSAWAEASNGTGHSTPTLHRYDPGEMVNTGNNSSAEASVRSHSANSYIFSPQSCDINLEML